MCVIAFSKKGVDIPSEETMKKMWEHNPDGAGYAYVGRLGKVYYKKGFMTLGSLLKDLNKNREKFKNTNFAIHFRIGTSGKNDPHTCHPFPISTNFGDLRKTHGKVESVLFHNGIIADGGLTNPLASDTQDFVVAMAPLLGKYNKSKARDYFLSELTVNNRMLVLYKNNKYKMLGKWEKDGDLLVSNTNYKTSYSAYDYHNPKWWDDWYAEREEEKRLEKLAAENPPTVGRIISLDKIDYTQAQNLFAHIITSEYAFVSPEELNGLKAYSDGFDKNVIEYSGYEFGYDEKQLLVWLDYEYTPAETKA